MPNYYAVDADDRSENDYLTTPHQTIYTAYHSAPLTPLQRLLNYANYIFAGPGHGGLFLFTNCAGAMAFFQNQCAAIAFGIAAGLSGGFANMSQAPQATRQLFSFRPDIWLLTLATAPTIGGYAALPIVAGVLQATQTIEDKTGIAFSKLNPVLGNLALITTSIVFSIGLVNQISSIFAYLMWKCLHKESYKYALMRKFINSQRSADELRNFLLNPDMFQQSRTARANVIYSVLSLFPSMLLALSIAPEITKAIDIKDQIVTMKGIIPIESFARTDVGSKIIALSTIGLLTASYAQDGLRAITRDFTHALKSDQKCKNLLIFAVYALYILSTSLTGALQSKESGDSLYFVFGTMLSVLIINFAGPRMSIFESRLAECVNPQSHYFVEKMLRAEALALINDEENETQPDNRDTCLNPFNWWRRNQPNTTNETTPAIERSSTLGV